MADKEDAVKEQEPAQNTSHETKPKDSIQAICASSTLDEFLNNDAKLCISYKVPHSISADYVSERTTGMPLPDSESVAIGVMAGLGIKRKTANIVGPPLKKAKTLSEKREALERDIVKYGMATVEKMYPRQTPRSKGVPGRRGSNFNKSVTKMKPKPSGVDFEEVDARDILKPLSHDKYIREPLYDSVVFITRRSGLVPLSSLCKDATTVMSSNVKLLKGRNVRLGKPSIFLKEKGRLLAIGGSRGNAPHFNITSVPTVEPKRSDGFEEAFTMDSEYVEFALKAMVDLPNVSKSLDVSERIDVRELKRRQREEEERKAAMTRRDVINKIYEKVITNQSLFVDEEDSKGEETADIPEVKPPVDQIPSKWDPSMELERKPDIKQDPVVKTEESNPNSPQCITENQPAEKTSESAVKPQEQSDFSEEDDENEDPNRGPVHLQWKDNPPIPRSNPLDIETKAIVSEAFKRAFEERKKNPIAGFEACDVENCYCKEKEETVQTCSQTPTSGSQTPSGTPSKNGEKKTKTRLTKVKRALKTLGVNFYEFDQADQVCIRVDCDKLWCRFGCICDCISGKAIPPSHCGKVECMFRCTCSEDTATYASSKKVGISPAGAANLRTNSQRHLAAEERKFHNTVISSGKDVVLLGSSGRTKRERKIPSRYQDAETVLSDHCGKNLIHVEKDPDIRVYSVLNKDAIRTVQEHLENETIQACTVLLPRLSLPSSVKHWCMIHCHYNCPCGKYKDPLDYGPDVNVRKMVSKPKGPKQKSILLNEELETFSENNPHQHDLRDHSARTFGYQITPSDGLKLTHKVVVQKVPKMDLLGPLSSKNLPENMKYSDRVHLEARPKGAIQYVKWSTLKEEFNQATIKLYLYERVTRSLVFITKANDSPYVIDAINLKEMSPEHYIRVPQQVRGILRPAVPSEGSKYAILTHNGLAWEFSGTIDRKVDAEAESSSNKKVASSPVEGAIPTNINGDCEVQKLALGKNLITLERSGLQTMQIKLPPTTNTQHWFIIRIDKDTGSIQIPDTTLALKTAVLKQAAALAKKESTTVRIPIPVSKEVSHFGVYAVPGLDTHVFVGPFSVQKLSESPKEVIDLDDDEEIQEVSGRITKPAQQRKKTDNVSPDDDDDIQVISDSLSSKDHLKALVKENNQVVNELLTSMSDQAVIYGETKVQREMKRNVSVSGPVPKLVSKGSEAEVVTLEEDSSMDPIGPNFNAKTVPYANLPTSQFGKIVYNSSSKSMAGDIILLHVESLKLTCRKRPSGMVTFPHPTFENHFVFCSSIENAALWVKEYLKNEELKKRRKPVARSLPMLAIKPMSSLMDAPVANKPNGKKEQLMGVSSFINPSGSQGVAYLLNSKSEHAELSKLFYELAIKTCRMKPTKQLSQSQILSKAMDEIQMLTAEEKELEKAKTKLKLERRDVFTKLKTALIGAPKEEKKRVLMSVKSAIRQLDLDDKDSNVKKNAKGSTIDQGHSPTTSIDYMKVKETTPPIPQLAYSAKSQSDMAWLNGLEPNSMGATPYSDVTGLQTLKKGKISRPMNAFMLWAKDHRKNLIANGYDGATVSKLLADEWKSLSAEQKSEYYKESEHLKSLHQLQHPNYKDGNHFTFYTFHFGICPVI
eukprot:TCALIF_02720-PA protein Name:"Similar to sox17a-b Transcription factor Sox-17-alpha-B (Xenopus laevis)" AED:0.27 eAED:0.29 QI:0/0.5/0.4/0.8/0.5/0.8/5/0/1615